MNTPGGNTSNNSRTYHCHDFAVARKIPQASASMAGGAWEKKKFMGTELYNKTLGVIGLGNIGGEVARRAQSLGMQVIAFDPFLSEEKANEMGIEKLEVSELIKRADFITVHTPLTTRDKESYQGGNHQDDERRRLHY